MCEILPLFEGYSTQIDDVTSDANCSCTLIKTPTKNVIVDTMTPWDKQEIIDALAKYDVLPKDINYVVCSHSHPDHIGNNNLFLEAEEHIIGTTVHHNTLFRERNIKKCDYKLCEEIKITSSPGHTADDVTVLVNGKFNGEIVNVAIAGDLFENAEDIDDPTIWMNLGMPELEQEQALSRCKIANAADYIIPGHGPFFQVTEEIRNKLTKQYEEIKLKQQS